MNVSNIFADFDLGKKTVQAEQKQAAQERLNCRAMVVGLMHKMVKPFADQVSSEGQRREMTIGIDDRGNDRHRPSFTIQFASYERRRPVIGSGPSIKLLTDEDFRRVEVTEHLGDSDDITFDGDRPNKYPVQMGQPDTIAKMSESLEAWLRKSLEAILSRK